MPELASTESRAVQREFELVQQSKDHDLITVKSLAGQLRNLGVRPGMTLLVHSSLSSLGWVCGGAPAVILALELVLGEEGTLVMPTHSTDLSDPAQWQHPGVPEKWWQQIRDEMPAYSSDLSPTREMGAISECFRKQDGTLRSYHPQVSFAARGKNAVYITGSHALEFSMGEGSPLARVYELRRLGTASRREPCKQHIDPSRRIPGRLPKEESRQNGRSDIPKRGATVGLV